MLFGSDGLNVVDFDDYEFTSFFWLSEKSL